MKLLFIFTGGTIGSTLDGRYISVDSEKPYKLIEAYKTNYYLDEYDVISPYTELSENNTGTTLKKLTECVLSHTHSEYDGIIVTHGTDTLQYSAAALGYVLGNSSVPVCIVSSNYPIEDERANGIINLHGAIEFIRTQSPKGVWVSYKNPNESLKIHRATRLLAGNAFSDRIDSIYNSYFGCFDESFSFHKNEVFKELSDEIAPLCADKLTDVCRCVLRISPYTGMCYPKLMGEIKYVLHESYHSGTVNTKSDEANLFFDEIKRRNIKVFMTGINNEVSYESTKYYDGFNIFPLINTAPPAMLIKLWLADSMGLNPEQIMNKSLSGDIVI